MPATRPDFDRVAFNDSSESLVAPTPAALRVSAAFVATLAAVAIWTVLPLPVPVGVGMVALVLVACSRRCGIATAGVIGVLGWLFVTGFVVNGMGELRITGSGDYWRLAFLAAVAVLSAALSRPTPSPRCTSNAA